MIRELKTLIMVAREGTFAAAGEKVGLTQAAVSAQMQRLELELGFPLFERKGRAARLNVRGQQIVLQAQELIRLYNSLGDVELGNPEAALVSIGAIASIQRSLLPDVLATFHQQFPRCRTRIIPGLSMELLEQVDAGELDLAVILRPPFTVHKDLRWTTLVSEPFRLIVPCDMQGDDWAILLANNPFVRYDRASFGGRQVDRFLRKMHFTVQEVCEVDELDAIVKLVANKVGVALVPQTINHREWPPTVRAIDLGHHTFHRDVGLVHQASRNLSAPVKTLARLLTEFAGS